MNEKLAFEPVTNNNNNYSEILLDTGANEHIFNKHSDQIRNISIVDQIKTFTSFNVNAPLIVTNEIGVFKDIITVSVSDEAPCNVISCSKLLEKAKEFIYNDESKSFKVTLINNEKLEFVLKNGIYLYNAHPINSNINNINKISSSEFEKVYTKKELEKAKQAYELVEKMGISYQKIRELINKGHLVNTNFTVEDLNRAQEAFGNPLKVTLGKFKNKKTYEFSEVRKKKLLPVSINLELDIFYHEGYAFLNSISVPMGVSMTSCLGASNNVKDKNILLKYILDHINMYRSYGFIVKKNQL